MAEGLEVSLYYDPLLGKLIVHGPDRPSAIARMQRALAELTIRGVETSVPFHRRLLAAPAFREGDLDIRFLERHPELLEDGMEEEALRAAAVAAALLEDERRGRRAVARIADGAGSRWRERGWR